MEVQYDYMTQTGFGPDKGTQINQDALLASEIPKLDLKIFSVFDGHGRKKTPQKVFNIYAMRFLGTFGHFVSNYLKTELTGKK